METLTQHVYDLKQASYALFDNYCRADPFDKIPAQNPSQPH